MTQELITEITKKIIRNEEIAEKDLQKHIYDCYNHIINYRIMAPLKALQYIQEKLIFYEHYPSCVQQEQNFPEMTEYTRHYMGKVIEIIDNSPAETSGRNILLVHHITMIIFTSHRLLKLVYDKSSKLPKSKKTSLQNLQWRKLAFCLLNFYKLKTGNISVSITSTVEIRPEILQKILSGFKDSLDSECKWTDELDEYYWGHKEKDVQFEMTENLKIINELSGEEMIDCIIILKLAVSFGELLKDSPDTPNLSSNMKTKIIDLIGTDVFELLKNLRNTLAKLNFFPNLTPELKEIVRSLQMLHSWICGGQQVNKSEELSRIKSSLNNFHNIVDQTHKQTTINRKGNNLGITMREPYTNTDEQDELHENIEKEVEGLNSYEIQKALNKCDMSKPKGLLAFQMFFIIFYHKNEKLLQESKLNLLTYIRNAFAHHDPVPVKMRVFVDEGETPQKADINLLLEELCRKDHPNHIRHTTTNGYKIDLPIYHDDNTINVDYAIRANKIDDVQKRIKECQKTVNRLHYFNWICFATNLDHTDITKLLINNLPDNVNSEVDVQEKNLSKFISKLIAQKIDESDICKFITAFINYFKDINAKSFLGRTALHVACIERQYEIVQLLVKHDKIKINAKDDFANTALHYASMNGDVKIVQHLLDNKARKEITNIFKSPASHYVVFAGKNDTKLCKIFGKLQKKPGDLLEFPIMPFFNMKFEKRLNIL